MPIIYKKNKATFKSEIREDKIVELRDFLQENAPDEIKFNFKECEDIHLAILQLIMAYNKEYSASYKFAEDKKLFQQVLEGFDASENHCN
jgi:hypothetical protein